MRFCLESVPHQTEQVDPGLRIGSRGNGSVRPAQTNLEVFRRADTQRAATDGELVGVGNVTNAVVDLRQSRRGDGGGGETFGADALRDAGRRDHQIRTVSGIHELENRRLVDLREVIDGDVTSNFKDETEHRKLDRVGQLAGLLQVGVCIGLGGNDAGRIRLTKLLLEEDDFGHRRRGLQGLGIIKRLLQRTQDSTRKWTGFRIRIRARETRRFARLYSHLLHGSSA